MSLELIAVEGLTLAHASGSAISGGTFTITSSPSEKAKCESKGIYTETFQFTFAGGSASGFVSGSVATAAPITMPATASKTKAMSSLGALQLVMREGDSVLMSCTGTIDPPATPPAGAVSGQVEISAAGQTTGKAQ